MSDDQKDALWHWAWFVVVLGLVPVLISYPLRWMGVDSDSSGSPIERGDLFLLAATSSFVGVGSLVVRTVRKERQLRSARVAAPTIIIGVVATLAFASVSNSRHLHGGVVIICSVVMYVLGVLCGGACAVLAERSD
jgi:hypothetical protein